MNQAILLDMDGVILNNKQIHKHIAYRCNKFVSNVTNIHNPIKVQALNKHLYESCGHTVIGLNKLGYNIRTKDFNEYIYQDTHIIDNIDKKDIRQISNFKEKCDDKNIELYIFSNASNEWCQNILDKMNVDIPIFNNNYLKPNIRTYINIQNFFEDKQILFVDDKMINLLPVMNNKKWKTYLYCHEIYINQSSNLINNFNIISNLDEVI
jgi:FMN phosphatase YigB (HAD superfamily)